MADPWNDPATRAWAREFEQRVVPAMRQSAAVAPVWTGSVDAKLAAEVGASVLLDKPLIVVVQSGADRILEADVTTDAGRQSLARRLSSTIGELVGRDTDG